MIKLRIVPVSFSSKFTFSFIMLFLAPMIMMAQGAIKEQINKINLAKKEFTKFELFTPESAKSSDEMAIYGVEPGTLSEAIFLNPKTFQQDLIKSNKPQYISLELPGRDGKMMTLQLYAYNFLTDDVVIEASGKEDLQTGTRNHLFYRGIVEGSKESLVSLSFIDDEITGIISRESETLVLGKVQSAKNNMHVLYAQENLNLEQTFECNAIESDDYEIPDMVDEPAPKSEKCVRVKIEIDNGFVNNLGGGTAAVNYSLSLWNAVTTLYANDNIDVVVGQVYAWTAVSPYNGTLTDKLFQLSNATPDIDLTALLTNTSAGGIAFLSGLCSTTFGVSVSGIYGYFNNVPTYSWDVNVCAHEIGHNLSSAHTHACAWNGNNTAIDGCGPTAGYSEGCTAPIPSSGGGTIMSYCHLLGGTGVNFNNGFGAQPTERMTNYINSRTCLGTGCATGGPAESSSCETINFSDYELFTYAGNRDVGSADVQLNGDILRLQNNAAKCIELNYVVTANTILEFKFRSSSEAQIHGIGFDNDVILSFDRIFKLHGTLNTGQVINAFDNYTGSSYKSYVIPVGQYYAGANLNKLFFATGNVNGASGGTSFYKDVRVYENGDCTPANQAMGIEDVSVNPDQFRIYPNPAQHDVTIMSTVESKIEVIHLYSSTGKLLESHPVNAQSHLLNMADKPAGVYILEIADSEGNRIREKLVKVN